MLLGDHYPRLIRIHLDHITFLDRSITAIEDQIRGPDQRIRTLVGSLDARHEITDQKAPPSNSQASTEGVKRVVEPVTWNPCGFGCNGGTRVWHRCR
jgi:hypothetical protein